MPSHIATGFLSGLQGIPVTVEVDVMKGLPVIEVVGMTDVAIQEAKKRIKSALVNSGFPFPKERIVVNLAPAHCNKRGALFDLPIALGILCEQKVYQETHTKDIFCIGELGLDGVVRGVPGTLALVQYAKEQGYRYVLVPEESSDEAVMVEGVIVLSAATIREAVEKVQTKHPTPNNSSRLVASSSQTEHSWDIAHIQGQPLGKRGVFIAACGGHNMLFSGPPGTGKTMLAKALQTLLPPLTFDEALEVTRVYSIASALPKGQVLITRRPFRSVHHTISPHGLLGGGNHPKPGEISLAHQGVLFLDELGEFPKRTLEVLRQPLEEGVVHIARSREQVTYPAHVQIVAATNPCPCGFLGDALQACRCGPGQLRSYQSRLSGPLLDRFDLFLNIMREGEDERGSSNATTSTQLRQKVIQCRNLQQERQRCANAWLSSDMLERYCPMTPDAINQWQQLGKHFLLSKRGSHRVLRVARTIADMEGNQNITSTHIEEAFCYRQRDHTTPKNLPSG